MLKYREISNKFDLKVKVISGFFIVPSDIKVKPLWIETLRKHIKAELIYPPILRLKLNKLGLALENRALDLVEEYSNDVIEFLINNKKKNKGGVY